MRPEILFPLFAPLRSLPGIGPRLAALMQSAIGGPNVVDLLWHFPAGIIDRRFSPVLKDVPEGDALATVTVEIDAHLVPRNPRQPYRIRTHDETGSLTLVYFRGHEEHLKRLLPVGETRIVSGRIQRYDGELQMTHPDQVGKPEDRHIVAAVEPVYRLTAGLAQSIVQKAMRVALERTPELPEWLDAPLVAREGWVPWRMAVHEAHAPASEVDVLPTTLARRRLAYDELLANQLALLLIRERSRRRAGRSIRGDGRLRNAVLAALPYRLTAAQDVALGEILNDMAAPNRMLRLLQGDVGSGKTVVALLAMLAAIECGLQAALMVPTEILARQHLRVIEDLIRPLGLRVSLLTGRDRGKLRQEMLRRLAAGEIDIVIGTHALLQEGVEFRDLGLVVVDEQHRFGVYQRLALTDGQDKGSDVLVMSATPIPRTLTLTVYGDMDASRLEEKPPGRQPIVTRAIPLERLDEVVAAVRRAVDGGARAYWVCPLVSESETTDLAAAEERYAALRELFGARVDLVHGKMKATDREAALERFATGDVAVLVATTVVEVGVDVPQATIMVIEHAERFGLAQLHQLRGRVGRGPSASSCLLLYAPSLTETGRARLQILRQTEDGFRIAEEDLRLRGAGEVLGARQSGLPEFRVADLAAHGDLLPVARDDAMRVLHSDPGLATQRGEALRALLYLFERDAAAALIRSG